MSEGKTLRAWKRKAEYRFFRLIEGTMSLLPQGARAWIAWLVLRAAGLVKLDKAALANLDLAYGDSISRKEKKRILRGLYKNLARTAAEILTLRKEGEAFVARIVETDESVRQLHRAVEAKRGAILVTPHFGNWELLPGWGKLQGFRTFLVGKRMKDSRLNDMLMEMRLRLGSEIVFHDESGRKLLRGLQENAVVGLLPDLDTARLDGIFVPFFGRPTFSPTSPASLSIITGAPIVPTYLVFEKGRYRMISEPAIEPGKERTDEEVRRITQAWSDSFERWIRKHPDHWMWFQRRWNITPQNAPPKMAKRRGG